MHGHPIRTAIFDIDGTLAMMDEETKSYKALPGALDAVAACRATGMDVIAYTNGTFAPPERYYPRLESIGLFLDPGHILTPGAVAAHHLRETGHRKVMVLGREGTLEPMRQAGFDVVLPEPGAGPVDAVLVGWTDQYGPKQIEALVQAVWDGALPYSVSDAPYFAGAAGRILGVSGAIGAMIQHTTGSEPVVLGKPAPLGMQMISELTGTPVHQMVVIGDDPKLESAMARSVGALAVGVTTGLYDRHDFMRVDAGIRAHLVLDSLEELLEQPFLKTQQGAAE